MKDPNAIETGIFHSQTGDISPAQSRSTSLLLIDSAQAHIFVSTITGKEKV